MKTSFSGTLALEMENAGFSEVIVFISHLLDAITEIYVLPIHEKCLIESI
jgi:hypothetical protein